MNDFRILQWDCWLLLSEYLYVHGIEDVLLRSKKKGYWNQSRFRFVWDLSFFERSSVKLCEIRNVILMSNFH